MTSKEEVLETSNSFGDQQTDEDEALDKIIAEVDKVEMQHSGKVVEKIVKKAILVISTEHKTGNVMNGKVKGVKKTTSPVVM